MEVREWDGVSKDIWWKPVNFFFLFFGVVDCILRFHAQLKEKCIFLLQEIGEIPLSS